LLSAGIGTLAQEIGIDHLVVVNAPEYGVGAGELAVHHVQTKEDARKYFEYLAEGDVVLVKASRSEGFEVITEWLELYWNEKVGVNE
jgi:UDP-N-acetylmuramoyl-tripeptide--D-alanyl-D-alanine ligase